jgi:Phage integrase, N-terminal SAM-like domain
MTPLRRRMIEDMTSAGLARSTQVTYIQGVRRLAAYYRRSPDQLSEAEVRAYLLHLRDGRGAARGTFRPYHGGIQFFFACTLDRDWPLFSKKESNRQSTDGCRSSCRTPRRERSLAA